jgi:hypothetical protein
MALLSADTSPDIKDLQIELLRQMPVFVNQKQMPSWRKIELLVDMNQTVRALALAGLRQRHPHDTPELRQRRLADLLLGPDLARRVYGDLPEEG